MKLKIITAVSGIVFFILFSTVALLPVKEPDTRTADEWAAYMKNRIPDLMIKQEVPGLIIAVIKDHETVWTDAFGYADSDNKIPMTIDTRCRVESISKSVTAWGVMKLVQEGHIDLDEPVESYLGNWTLPVSAYSDNGVTVRRLLNQTSGMPLGTIGVRYSPEGDLPPLRDFLKTEAVLRQEPGLGFSYSNTGYNLLELLIEEVSGMDFAEYMQKEVLSPLGMNSSDSLWSSEWQPPVPYGYDLKGKAVPVYVYPDKASGGLFSTAADITSFLSAGMSSAAVSGSNILSSSSIELIYTTSSKPGGYYSVIFDGYGFGHFTEKLSGDVTAVSHGGQGSGWMTQFYSVPTTGDGIVLLSNSQRSWPLFAGILTEWSRFAGLPEPGMSLIAKSASILRMLIAMLFVLILFAALLRIHGLAAGRLKFIKIRTELCLNVLLQITASFILTATVIAISRLDYFFLDSVFPVETPIAKGLMILSAVYLLFKALTLKNAAECSATIQQKKPEGDRPVNI